MSPCGLIHLSNVNERFKIDKCSVSFDTADLQKYVTLVGTNSDLDNK